MNRGKYSKELSDLSNLTYSEFKNTMETTISKFDRSFKTRGKIAIIISNKRDNGTLINIEQDINNLFQKYYTLRHKIIVPYHNTYEQTYKRAEKWSKRDFLLIGHRTLFIY
ncbi:hypothetical protein LCGC14_0710010 [marine sediment metagenome]|uniref:Uncharacterized protein n=1 Tax=marine sediment metagenome TaxID=412755 RepID=A0A0F9TMV7_9ZZZZ|nr:hypothetical protein [bacterium]